MEELALKAEHVSKEYRLGQIGGGTLKAEIQSKFAKWRHKEDPNLKIDEKAYEKNERFLALDDVSFEIKKGEKIGIIGHNGAGKSTILKLICRVTAPTKGNIYLNGRITSMLEVGTGFHGELTGRENIYLNGSILGMSKAEIDEKIDEIIEFSEVKQFIDTPVKRYSSGMHVKLGFAVASHLNSEIMIMDEVLAVGDMAFQNKCINQMKKVADEEGRTILYVSHNMNTIRQLCDRCIVLDHGTVAFIGDVEEAISIYLGRKIEQSDFIDCNRTVREPIGDGAIHINTVRLLNAKDAVLYNDNLDIEVNYTSKKTFGSVAFRSVLFNSSHIPVGMSTSSSCISVKQGENSIKLSLMYPNLACGQYHGRIVFYEVDDAGNESIHDVVENAIVFSKEFKTQNNLIEHIWNQSIWGNAVFPEITVL